MESLEIYNCIPPFFFSFFFFFFVFCLFCFVLFLCLFFFCFFFFFVLFFFLYLIWYCKHALVMNVFFSSERDRVNINTGRAEPEYAMPLQTV